MYSAEHSKREYLPIVAMVRRYLHEYRWDMSASGGGTMIVPDARARSCIVTLSKRCRRDASAHLSIWHVNVDAAASFSLSLSLLRARARMRDRAQTESVAAMKLLSRVVALPRSILLSEAAR